MASVALAFDILARDKASREVEQVGTSAEKSGGKLQKMGAAGKAAFATIVTAAVTAGIAATKGFLDGLDQGAITDAAAASLGLSPADSAELGKIAGSLYADAYGDSFGTVADAVASVRGELGDLGADELEGLTANALDFATAFKQDITQSVGAAGSLLRNELVKDGEEAFDILTAAMQRVPPSVRDEILAATSEYSTFFADLGITGSEAFSLIATSAQKGGNYGVDKVGDALKELTIRATDMSTASVEAFEAAGLNAEKMAARFLEGGPAARDALDDLIKGLSGIEDPVKRSNAAIGLFGTPLEDLSVTEIPEFLSMLGEMEGGLGDVEGATDRMGDTLNDNLKTKLESWKRKGLQAIVDLMATKVIPFMEDVGEKLEEWGPAIEAFVDDALAELQGWWDDNGPTIITTIETIRDVAEELFEKGVAGVEWFIENWDKIKPALLGTAGVITAVMIPHWVALGVAAVAAAAKNAAAWVVTSASAIAAAAVHSAQVVAMVAKWAFLGAQSLLHAGKVAAAWVIAMGPIAWVIVGMAALVALIIVHWDTIRDTITGAAGAVIGWLQQNWPLLLAIITGPIGLAVLAIVRHWDEITGAATAAKDWIVDRFDELMSFFTGIPGRLGDIAEGMFDAIPRAFKTALNVIIDAWNRLDFEIDIRVPGWVPGIGGEGFRVRDIFPDVPRLHSGGTFHAPPGMNEGLALLLDGERVLSPAESRDLESSQQKRMVEANFYGVDRDTYEMALNRLTWELTR